MIYQGNLKLLFQNLQNGKSTKTDVYISGTGTFMCLAKCLEI